MAMCCGFRQVWMWTVCVSPYWSLVVDSWNMVGDSLKNVTLALSMSPCTAIYLTNELFCWLKRRRSNTCATVNQTIVFCTQRGLKCTLVSLMCLLSSVNMNSWTCENVPPEGRRRPSSGPNVRQPHFLLWGPASSGATWCSRRWVERPTFVGVLGKTLWGRSKSTQKYLYLKVVVVVSQFNGTSTPKGSYSAKTGDNDCNVNSSRYSLSTALCESNSLSGQVWTKCPTRLDTQGAQKNSIWYSLYTEYIGCI